MPTAHMVSQGPSTQPSIDAKRDKAGRFTERTVRLGDALETRRYAYDSAGRLSRVTDERSALCESYTYDHQGRRLADICPELRRGERRYTYGPGNRLGQAGQVQYGHDRAGFRNLKVETTPQSQRATRYHYEPSGLLLAVDLPDGRRIEYTHDASGLRTEKRVTVNGVGQVVTEYIWLDPLRLGGFHDGSQWWRFIYDQGRSPVGVENGREQYLILSDQVGTPLALANRDGSVVQHMRYDSFGNLIEVWGNAVPLPLGFAGGLFDADTGLTRFVWRDYDADTGRFTALDPLGKKGGDKDWYGYCVDDPVNRVDVWGLASTDGKPYFCRWAKCDENGTMQGDYKPIDIHPGAEPFLTDFSVPLSKRFTNWLGIGDPNDPKEVRLPLLPDLIVGPFRNYYEEQQEQLKE
jgi:RHS repeat-associated protein